MKRRSLSPLQRLKLFEAAKGVCHLCEQRIQVGEKWEVEHVIPLALGGADDESNTSPAHVACHAPKTAADLGAIAKVKRIRAKHIGADKPRGFPKPPPGFKYSWKTKRMEKMA